MKSVVATIFLTPPVDATDNQIQEWVEYCTGYRGSISMDNPLNQYDLEADSVDVDI